MNIVTAGCGIAGYTAAVRLLEWVPNATITLFDSENHGLYAKMRLPEYIAGKLSPEKLILTSQIKIQESGIHYVPDVAIAEIDPERKTATDSNGKQYAYDKLILATGASANIPPIPGIENAFPLRTLRDASLIAEKAACAKQAAVIGGGLLGLEAANALRLRGVEVTILEAAPRLLPRQLSECESAILAKRFVELGYGIRTGVQVQRISGTPCNSRLELSDGSAVEAQLILVSAGIRPNTGLAEKTGIAVRTGISVNHRFETSLPDIYAVGDCAAFENRVFGLWAAAKDHAEALAGILAGKLTEYTPKSYDPTLKIPGVKLSDIRKEAGI